MDIKRLALMKHIKKIVLINIHMDSDGSFDISIIRILPLFRLCKK